MKQAFLGAALAMTLNVVQANDQMGAVLVRVLPEGRTAEFFLNGQRVHEGPKLLQYLPIGPHEIHLKRGEVEVTEVVVLGPEHLVIREIELVPPRTVIPASGESFRDVLKDGSQSPEMVVIPATDNFTIGSPSGEAGRVSDESQKSEIQIAQFAMGKNEVTFDEYDAFARATGRDLPSDEGWGRGTRPVINVSWHDAVAYTEWLSEQTGYEYRLPTEAEWEYAARGGTTRAYWRGASVGRNNANCNGCGSQWDNRQTAPVGSFQANPFGLFDMAGNVREWTGSVYSATYNGNELQIATKKDASGSRVLRGGSWSSTHHAVRSAYRSSFHPDERGSDVGFRVARSL